MNQKEVPNLFALREMQTTMLESIHKQVERIIAIQHTLDQATLYEKTGSYDPDVVIASEFKYRIVDGDLEVNKGWVYWESAKTLSCDYVVNFAADCDVWLPSKLDSLK